MVAVKGCDMYNAVCLWWYILQKYRNRLYKELQIRNDM